MKLLVREISVGDRIRKNLGDLHDLKQSIIKYGQLQPILIDPEKNLIAGFRRLEALKQLNIEYVEIKIIEISQAKEKIEIEIEENRCRENFSDLEKLQSTQKLNAIKDENFFQKIGTLFLKYLSK